MNKADLKIFSVFHKEFAIPNANFIEPIQVGKLFSNIDLNMCSDDVGDNIAQKNQTHAELTALYWIWKHIDEINADYIGLCHYRRYFITQRIRIKNKILFKRAKIDPSDVYMLPLNDDTLNSISAPELKNKIVELLKNADILLPKQINLTLKPDFPLSIKDHYIYHHIKEDWWLMREVTLKLYPELTTIFDRFFEEHNSMHGYNMLIATKAIFKDYCAWLFPIIDELEKMVKLSDYPYQRRIFGFFSERLLNLYIHSKNLIVAELPVAFIND